MIYISELFPDYSVILICLVSVSLCLLHIFQLDISGLYTNILDFLNVCQSVSQSLTFFTIGYFWGSTSETSGLVNVITQNMFHKFPSGMFQSDFDLLHTMLPIGGLIWSTSPSANIATFPKPCLF